MYDKLGSVAGDVAIGEALRMERRHGVLQGSLLAQWARLSAAPSIYSDAAVLMRLLGMCAPGVGPRALTNAIVETKWHQHARC